MDLVIDSTGAFKEKKDLNKHIENGAKEGVIDCSGKTDTLW